MKFTILISVLLVTNQSLGFLKAISTVSLCSKVLQEVLSGPLAGCNIVLYLDLGDDMLVADQLLAQPTLQDIPHVLVNLDNNGTVWSKNQNAAVLRGIGFIHVVLFRKNPRPFFEAVSPQWNPKYVMLFSLFQGISKNIINQSFHRVEKLVLFNKASPRFPNTTGLYTFFPFSKTNKLKFIGNWNSTSNVTMASVFIDRFPSFEGYQFHIATWNDDSPFLYQKNNAPKGKGDGVVVCMLDAIAEMLNFRYTMTTKPQDCMWGSFVNGSWNGILGMVHRKEKNFTVNTMLVTEARGKDFDFGVWYWMEGFGVMLMNPAPLAKWRGIYYSFQPSLWFAVILTAVSVIVIMTLQDRIQPEPLLGGLGGTWMYMLRTLVNQELTVLPRAQWQRLFLASWLFYCFILTTAYIANLIAFVTTPVFPERLHTLHQLAHSNYRLAMVNYGDFVPEALRSSKSDEYTRLWRKLDLCQEYNEVLALMTQQTHAFVELYSYSKVLLKTKYQLNHTYMMKEQLYPSYFAWLYPKNTAWRYKFDQGVRHLVEAGLVSHWYKEKIEELLGRDREKWERVEARQQRKKKGPLNLHHLEGVFFILVISWAASAVVLLLELLFHSSLTSTASSSLALILMI